MFNTLFGFFGKGKENNSNKSEESDNYTYCDTDKTLNKEYFEQFKGNVKFVDLDEDDIDWLLIEKVDDEDCEEKNKSPNSNSPCLALVPFKSVFARANDDGENILLSSNLPSLYSNSMDDSWFLTPPECFSSLSTIQLESSPLENLLIEHPSMSVYGKLKKKALTNADVFDDLVIVELGAQNDMVKKLIIFLIIEIYFNYILPLDQELRARQEDQKVSIFRSYSENSNCDCFCS
jgi:hypothetical protein